MEDNSLNARMKSYEDVSDYSLTPKIPTVIRADGKSFSNWTSGLQRPFDDNFRSCMEYATYRLCKEIEGARFGFTQSDEISILLIDYATIATQPFFGNRLQKMVSVAASICTSAFITAALKYIPEHLKLKGLPKFDARVFSLPGEEVSNYFLSRSNDGSRNSIQQVARCYFSQKQLHGKSCDQIQEMLFQEHKLNWNDTSVKYKRGVCIYKVERELECFNTKTDTLPLTITRRKWYKDYNMPIISQNTNYINRWLENEPDYNIVNPDLIDCLDFKPEF